MKHPLRSILNGKILTLALILALPLLYRLTPLRELLGKPAELRSALEAHAAVAPGWFIPVAVGLLLLGFPRLLVCTLGGLLHGLWLGVLLSQSATLIAAVIIFEAARRLGPPVPERVETVLSDYGFRGSRAGVFAVFSARQLPIPGFLLNIGLGSCQVERGHFLLGTLLGFLPLGLPATAVGAGMLQPDQVKAWGMIGGAAALLLGIALGIRIWQGRRNGCRALPPT